MSAIVEPGIHRTETLYVALLCVEVVALECSSDLKVALSVSDQSL